MDSEEALAILRRSQPMPADRDWDEESQRLEEARRYFCEDPVPECLPLILRVFGDGSGYGVYQRIEDVVQRFPKQDVLPYLIDNIQTGSRSIRYWNAQIAAVFPDRSLIEPLKSLLYTGNIDLIEAAILALGQIDDPLADSVLTEFRERGPTDRSTLELLGEVLSSRRRL